jgi:hypothetical protein
MFPPQLIAPPKAFEAASIPSDPDRQRAAAFFFRYAKHLFWVGLSAGWWRRIPDSHEVMI